MLSTSSPSSATASSARPPRGPRPRWFDGFLHLESASGILLLTATVVALVWANTSWPLAYETLWHLPLGLTLGPWAWRGQLHFLVNDGLMTIFFLAVGLEIRNDIHDGELSDPRRAALPVIAAAGGMIAPALLYLMLNFGRSGQAGWGIPMATDIAFAVAVVGLLGKRIPPALRVLLLALAIIDDIGAILVIAFFYSAGIDGFGLLVAALGLVAALLFQRLRVNSALVYVLPGVVVWWGLWRAGVHPTMAGVALGLATPARPWRPSETSPAVRVHRRLEPWVTYGIMPLFALANAGVAVGHVSLGGNARIVAGVMLGLVVGKPLGIFTASLVAVKIGVSALPRGVGWHGILCIGFMGGIGFTLGIFMVDLAFPSGAEEAAGKLAVLASSVVATVFGLLAGRLLLRPRPATLTSD